MDASFLAEAANIVFGERSASWVHDFPATPEQDERRRSYFISAISHEKVKALALRHSTQTSCRILSCNSGSFNANFIIEFGDETKCVVRIPILPFVYDPWKKILGHVAISEYLKDTTRVPVARVRAYGSNEQLSDNGDMEFFFLIVDFIPGQNQAPSAGIPGAQKQGRLPEVGDLRSIPLNELRRSVPPTTSVQEYMKSQLKIISDSLALPAADQTIDDIKLEAFAIHFMGKYFTDVEPGLEEDGYPLHHSDLRLPNIIVGDDLQINGIIDWDDASTVPGLLFSPPPWIPGVDENSIMAFHNTHGEFRSILKEKAKTNSACGQLLRQWYKEPNEEPNEALYVAHIIRYPTEFAEIVARFYERLCPTGNLRASVHTYYESNDAIRQQVQQQAELCEEYTRFLKDRGLYIQEEPLNLQALNAKAKEATKQAEEIIQKYNL
ncbi:phosphotransferase enzyme family protein [Metarhizium acridum CQMa 102]|uniref:Phosphotransferase enzyme family protein n=1 Tax=Metarhizium acridum (strain CQMa 102) TaxID=655827 RepID=E9DU58_METAQ|nr:phosphotransferase enzyme family protein [Metarhizium acridum CQMa 102]EFY92918.1 phosphotransferase enzyme family protein [Metarhizium acridum CQMa 102]